ncbi:sushi, von Willebrand factor type A, EGF and pentraxin domain-containing protein 1-like [Branchiostoma lanceolatum]|uniref:sushi, von Willebrand factor type A, EGF and pentraxin domain-containing protein 1-like n=1 Tax=Branchiostoma lanceolatum TaxID=7740 RepID=UPI0034561575
MLVLNGLINSTFGINDIQHFIIIFIFSATTCSNPVDLVFLIDSSESFRTSGFRDALTFVQTVVNYFTLGENDTRVGVVTYSNEDAQVTRIKLNENYTRVELLTEIRDIPYDRGHTFTGLGLDHVRNNSFLAVNGRRSNTLDFLVVLTDDESEDDVIRPARLIRQAGINVFVVGVGEEADISQATLENIAGTPSRVFRLTDHDFLTDNTHPTSIREAICNAAQCPDLTAPTNGARTPPTEGRSFQNVITFTCNTGYVLNGAARVTCQADTTWTAPVPTCTPRQCTGLTAPTNGARTPLTGSNFYQNVITFTCDTGYVRNGAASVTCQANGLWTAPVPTCPPVQCPLLTAPNNGARTPTNGATAYQDVVTFTCNSGYVLNGATTRTCQADGTWSNTAPTCTPRQCPALGAPTNGARTPTTGARNYQDTITFTCDPGYTRNGAASVTCQADGTWTALVPTCAPIQCPALGAPTNGARTPTTGGRSFQNVITFTCDTGYVLNGAASVTCQADTTWTAPVPTCARRQCQALLAPANGARTPLTGSNFYQNVITFTCDTGYVLNGAASVTCQANGLWTAPTPTCTPVQCPLLTAPNNGARTPTAGATSYQNTVTFTCNSGYVLNGVSSRTCQADGTWSNTAPTCTPRQCQTLAAPANGALSPTGPHAYPTTVTFTCNTGYTRNGPATTTCQADGSWGPVPTCTPVQCQTLTAPANGALSTTARTYQTVVTTTCNTGYTPNGVATTTCQADGTWTNAVPACRLVQCPALTAPANGARTPATGATSFQNTVTFTCDTGYVLNGAASVTCQADTTWTNVVPTCTRRQCQPALTAPANGARAPATGATSYQDTVTFTCNTGYQLNGAATLTCQADGTWTALRPTCTRICPTLAAPTNGARTPPTGATAFQDVVTFSCNSGYVLNGASTRTCQADGTWSNTAPTCTPRPCPTLTAPTNGALSPLGPYVYLNVVTFTCDSGYVRNGDADTTCQADGRWSNPVPTCIPGQCSTLAAPANGARTPPTGATNFQDTVTFTCDAGYVLNGAATSTCQAGGTWSNPVRTCTPRQCSPVLTAPANGALSTAARTFQTVVTTTCDAGYTPDGVATTTCQADGTWTNAVPACRRRQCQPALTAPANGARTPATGATSYQDTVTFTCNTGYRLDGAATLTCQADGTWSNPAPTCRRICPTLAAPTNGARTPPTGATAFQDVVTFSCNSGYVLNGASTRTCQADGTWSNTAPTCNPRPCPTLTAPTNGALSPLGPHAFPAVVTFTCNSGYVRNGVQTTTCQADGTWSNPTPPTCIPGQCSTLAAPANGARTPPTGATNFQDTVTFTCNAGYVLNGAATSTCQAGGTWSNPVRTCTPRQCSPVLTAPANGALSTAARTFQTVVTTTCDTGYTPDGVATTTCQADGTWTNAVPACRRRQCQPALTAPANGARSPATGATSYQDTVTFTCNTGYTLDGAATVTCRADGTWSNAVPTCRPGQCPLLVAPTNGARTPPTGATSFQDVVQFTCDAGYTRNGAASATCQAGGTWSNAVPTCTPRPCQTLTPPTNGALSPTGQQNYPATVTFTCNAGYVRNGAADATCQTDGSWNNAVPTCTPRQCQTLAAPANGARSPTGPQTFPATVTFTCNTGYTRNGPATTTCQADGSWGPVPTCDLGQCPTLTAPANGALSTTARTFQTVVTFTCDSGYTRNGAADTTCQAGGAWSNTVPTCTPRPCQTLTAPANGVLSPLAPHVYPAVVTFTCNTGYARNGAATTTCQTDGTWNNAVPTCTRRQCPLLSAPANGALSTAARTYQTQVSFTCDSGYDRNGASDATCQADGTWSRSVPTCEAVTCPTLTAPANGVLNPAGENSYPNTVTLTCDTGYATNGATTFTCQADRTWNFPIPTCRPVQCPQLTAPVNGELSPPGATSYPDVVRFACDQGYELVGADSATCQADQTWSEAIPTCRVAQCRELTAPTNGARTPSTGATSYQNTVTFSCNTGYRLNGDTVLTCRADGTWTNAEPTCTAARCQTLTPPANGVLNPTGANTFPVEVTVTCNTGHERNGTSSVTCQSDGRWSSAVATCTPVQCLPLSAPTNGNLSPAGATSYQNVVQFTCDQGYVLNGASSTRCQADRSWSAGVPTCTVVQCPMLSAPDNGGLSPVGLTSYQDMVTFTCNTGYTQNGAATSTCQADGTWSTVPTCRPVQCQILSAPANGTLSTGANSYPTVVQFTCNLGYERVGVASASCQADGTWSDPVATCRPVQCQLLTNLANGVVRPANRNTYQDVVQFSCNTGFELNGASAATCRADRTWSELVPTCTDINECTRNMCHSLATCTNTIGGFTCTCLSGYTGDGLTGGTGCTDINECNATPGPCHQQAVCTNIPGSFTCNCTVGYTGNGLAGANGCTELPCDRIDLRGWDLLFLVDSADLGGGQQTFVDEVRSFTRETIDELLNSDGVTRIGLVQYNDNQQTAFNLNQYQTKADILSAVDNINYLGGGTYTGRAIHYARQFSFSAGNGNRANRPDAMIVITDGVSLDPITYASTASRHQGITVFAIGIGNRIDRGTLEQIAENDQKVLQVSNTAASRSQAIRSLKGWLCRGAYCGDPGAPPNGTRQGTFYQGGKVDFSCSDGYSLVGRSSVTCDSTGRWIGNYPPTCILGDPCTPNLCANGGECFPTVTSFRCRCASGFLGGRCDRQFQCPTLSALTNGALSTTATANQTVVTFTCNAGYILNGDATTTCQADERWSNPVPTCTPRQCSPLLTAPANGALSTTARTYQTVVTTTCNAGYTLNGVATTTCQANGQWSNAVPTCTPIQCSPVLTAPANGALSTTARTYQTVVTTTCDAGYDRNGAATTTCQADGTWSNPVPTCTAGQCQTLTAPTNGALSPLGPHNFPATVTFTCNTGYTRNGADTTTCQAGGSWNNPVPTCDPRQCSPVLTAPANGALSTTARTYQTVVTTTCNAGYSLDGAATTTCQADGTWSNTVPTCRRDCPVLTAPANGALSTTARTYQTVVTTTCDSGYVQNGAATTTCQAGGAWSNAVPTCTPRPCPTLTAPTNGALSPLGPHAYPTQVTFTCNSGYVRNGVENTRCQADGTWSNPTPPTCIPGQCSSLATPTNGARTPPTGATNFQDTVTFNCDAGYVLNGATTSTCQAGGTWSSPTPTCTPKQCPDLTAPAFGSLSPTGRTNYQDVVNFNCNPGYTRNGATSATCQADGTWSNPVPTCTPRQCLPQLTAPTNGAMSPLGPHTFPATVAFTCNTGYTRNGAADTTCQADGSWNNPVPTCDPVQCPVLRAPMNGTVTPPGARNYNDVGTFACDVGFERVGATSATCQANGQWSNPVPICRPVQCLAVTAPANGARTPPTGANSYQDMVTFTCNQGYDLIGDSNTTCKADRTWTRPVPRCRPATCDRLRVDGWDIVFLMDSTTSVKFGRVKNLTRDIADRLLTDGSQTRVGLVQFSDNPVPTFDLNTHNTKAAIIGAIEGATRRGGGTFAGSALTYVKQVSFATGNGGRQDRPDALIVVTDGVTFDDVSFAAQSVREGGITAFAVGAGDAVNSQALRAIAKDPYKVRLVANDTQHKETVEAIWRWFCLADVCPDRGAPTNGVRKGTKYQGEKMYFSCDDGYVLDGTSPLTCTGTFKSGVGTWSGPDPTCKLGDVCNPNPCLNGGMCFPDGSGYRCDCKPGFVGINCQFRSSPTVIPGPTTAYIASNTTASVGPNLNRLNGPGWDVVFLLDSSDSVGSAGFLKVRNVTQTLVRKLPLLNQDTHIGIAKYSDRTEFVEFLKDYQNKSNTIEKIEGTTRLGGGTLLGDAITNVRTVSFTEENGNRPNIPDALVVVTDGNSADDVVSAVEAARRQGIHVFAVGVGDNVDRDKVNQIAGKPERAFTAPSTASALTVGDDVANWLNTAPECSNPGQIPNGLSRGTTFVTGQMDFSCDDGYTLIGPSSLTCMQEGQTGKWLGTVPVCGAGNPCASNPCTSGRVCTPALINNATGFQCQENCQGLNMPGWDLLLLVDGSREAAFSQNKAFARDLVDRLPISNQQATRIGLVQFSDTNRQEFHLNRYSSKQAVLSAIDNVTHTSGGSFIGNAIDYARLISFTAANGNRAKVPDGMIVVTDGRTDDAVEFPSTGARHQGITTFAVGIGSRVNRQTLDTITRDPAKVLIVTNTGNSKTNAMNLLVRWLCRGAFCDDPGPPRNGSRRGNFFQGGYVDFFCDDGFVLNGATPTRCQTNSNWTEPVPVCGLDSAPLAATAPWVVPLIAGLVGLAALALLALLLYALCGAGAAAAPPAAPLLMAAAPIEKESQIAIVDFVPNKGTEIQTATAHMY